MTATETWWRRRQGPLVYGHRGVRGRAPENTLAAFHLAADEGADGIELDVRVCATGELCVIHDPDLARVTDGRDSRLVADLTLDELGGIDVGEQQRVPTLESVLDVAERRNLLVNVEMKRDAPRRHAIVRATARATMLAPRVSILVSSFDPWMLAELGILAPAIPRALLVSSEGLRPHVARAAGLLRVVALNVPLDLATPAFVARSRARGFAVNAWTINEPSDAARLAASGVDGIITDVPRRIRIAV